MAGVKASFHKFMNCILTTGFWDMYIVLYVLLPLSEGNRNKIDRRHYWKFDCACSATKKKGIGNSVVPHGSFLTSVIIMLQFEMFSVVMSSVKTS